INAINLDLKLNEKELEEIDELYIAKLEVVNKVIVPKRKKRLNDYFDQYLTHREVSISKAVADGYKQIEIANYLNLSSVAVSKIYKKYREKNALFNKLRDKGIFWSYSREITYEQAGEKLLIEYLLKYGDLDDMKLGFELFGKRVMKRVWEERLKSDQRFIKLNLMIARVFLGMDVESDYFKEVKNARLEKLRLLAS
ncbi:MAG: hypothetical protein U9Q90_06825, partial [Campylobacterota bacterium]|nr:hypothetical protein [Campylobacterota bacterium]